MSKKKDGEERDEQDERNKGERHEQDEKREGVLFHGLTEPADEIHKELREQDRIREQQQIEAQAPRQEQAGTPPPAGSFPFTASINEPHTVSLPVPEGTEIPKPSISSLNPTETEIGGEDFTLYVSGENIFRDSVINFAGQDEPSTLNEDGTLSTIVKPSLWADPVTVPVIIKNGPESSEPVDFAFNAPPASRSRKKGD
jgi:IPT/TIG domain